MLRRRVCARIPCALSISWRTSRYYQYKDLHQAVKSKKSVENKKAKVLWALKEAKDKVVHFHDAGHEKEIKTRAPSRGNTN